jgi:glycosyltransferase involved in cell wall biosynthesis
MSKFIGIKKDRILMISDHKFQSDSMKTIELPTELHNTSPQDLISNYQIVDGKIINKSVKKSVKDMKIALVGNWKMKCGISTYAEYLWAEVAPHFNHYKLFIEHNDLPTGDIYQLGKLKLKEDQVVSCWKRGESLKHLTAELKNYNPDIIWIQHEFGLWSNASNWLSFMNQISEFRTIITMHSVFHHKDKTICEAAMPEVIVHLDGAYKVLKEEKHIPGKVYVIPHGCNQINNEGQLWNYYKSNKTFMQFGFGFRYKGWENCIRATAILKQKYKDVFFTGLFSESQFNKVEHQLYYNELMDLVEQLDVVENVAIIRGYQSDESLDSYMRTNQVVIFPYVSHPEHEVYGASGAARMAFSKGCPVVSSSVNHFTDIPTIKADSVEDIASALDKLFTNQNAKIQQIKVQNKYVEDNTWAKIAEKHISVFESKN